jgi:hypothetical protein
LHLSQSGKSLPPGENGHAVALRISLTRPLKDAGWRDHGHPVIAPVDLDAHPLCPEIMHLVDSRAGNCSRCSVDTLAIPPVWSEPRFRIDRDVQATRAVAVPRKIALPSL